MTTIERKKLEMVLEALEAGDWYIGQLEMIVYLSNDTGTHEERAKVQAAITAIKEVLAQPDHIVDANKMAQPAQEPVGSLNITSYKGLGNYDFDYVGELPDGTYAVYTTPPAAQQEPLVDCPRCGKRTADLTVIHTCTPPEGGHQ